MSIELKAKAGMEKLFNDAIELKAQFEAEKENAHLEVENAFAEKFAKIENIFELCADKVEIPEENADEQPAEEVTPVEEVAQEENV